MEISFPCTLCCVGNYPIDVTKELPRITEKYSFVTFTYFTKYISSEFKKGLKKKVLSQTLDKKTLDTTNPRHDKHLTQQTLDIVNKIQTKSQT